MNPFFFYLEVVIIELILKKKTKEKKNPSISTEATPYLGHSNWILSDVISEFNDGKGSPKTTWKKWADVCTFSFRDAGGWGNHQSKLKLFSPFERKESTIPFILGKLDIISTVGIE